MMLKNVSFLSLFISIFILTIANQSYGKHSNKNNHELARILLDYLDLYKRNLEIEHGVRKEHISQFYGDATLDRLKLLIYRFEAVLRFLEYNVKDVNLDGLYGIRIAQGALKCIVKQDEGLPRDPELARLVIICKKLSKRIDLLADNIATHVEQAESDYYQKFKYLVDIPFMIPDRKVLKLSFTNEIAKNKIQSFSEGFSDNCYTMLMGTTNSNSQRCSTSHSCFNYYTNESATDYFLTHQLLYFLIADHINCTSTTYESMKNYLITNEPNGSITKKLLSTNEENYRDMAYNYYCSKIYNEVQLMAQSGVSRMHKDLFLEQLVLCNMAGFNEFLNEDWIDIVLKIQQNNGCFGVNPAYKVGLLKDNVNETDSIAKEYNNLSNKRRNRHKRYDTKMVGGCSSHETGLGIAFYGIAIQSEFENLIDSN